MGLSYPEYSINGVVPIYTQLMNDGVVDSGIFSFYIHRESSHHSGDHPDGGEIAWGGVNPQRFEGNFPDAFQWVNVSRKVYWQISMGTVTVEDTDPLVVCQNGCEGKDAKG